LDKELINLLNSLLDNVLNNVLKKRLNKAVGEKSVNGLKVVKLTRTYKETSRQINTGSQ